jgi:hypothetical protein
MSDQIQFREDRMLKYLKVARLIVAGAAVGVALANILLSLGGHSVTNAAEIVGGGLGGAGMVAVLVKLHMIPA